ncbi:MULTISPECIES: methyltransferase domain-containing protein [unclassified Streptomyces]|uniref:methyltransferase domain-containing protein n=1 Tax=unclassified Streptomyces TaxID=2593676 RepID=UPI0016610607|nr:MULTISPECIES: methyltransferase domain-containing protein [unclassified Streptomyces]MBD0710663.1 methyltransferase type 11 [Streptomyces sp. CBMA291]MBD0715510.1 methyltransferase type 11 [Streptomyces sp. CBMA370]
MNEFAWQEHAERHAERVADPDSRWFAPVARTARHALVPRWWEADGEGRWALRDGPADPVGWAEAAYSDRSLVTRVGPLHADHARPGDRPEGLPTSSATMPSLIVRMLRHARLGDGLSVLDLGTGAGGLTAYACRRLGERCVTSLDVDSYLVEAARERLARMGLAPRMVTADATGHIPGTYDRIVSTVGLPAGPALRPVVAALKPGGRLTTTLGRTCLIVTGWKLKDGAVSGVVERDMAGFMPARSGADYPPALARLLAHARTADGEERTTGRYPVLNLAEAWELRSLLEVVSPGVECAYEADGRARTALLAHPDGSWARAFAEWTDPPEVHQGGPRRLWAKLESLRHRLNAEGVLPLLGARALVTPDGVVHLSRGNWRGTLGAP